MASEEIWWIKKGHSPLFTHSVAKHINLVPLHANFRARFMSAGLSPPIKISRRRWLSSRGYRKDFPSAGALIRRGEEEVMDIIASMRNSALAAGHGEISFISARVSHWHIKSRHRPRLESSQRTSRMSWRCFLLHRHARGVNFIYPPFLQIISLWQQQQQYGDASVAH